MNTSNSPGLLFFSTVRKGVKVHAVCQVPDGRIQVGEDVSPCSEDRENGLSQAVSTRGRKGIRVLKVEFGKGFGGRKRGGKKKKRRWKKTGPMAFKKKTPRPGEVDVGPQESSLPPRALSDTLKRPPWVGE